MLKLHIRNADYVTHSGINALMPKIGIQGTLQNWHFAGEPLDIQNLRYLLTAADWRIIDTASYSAYLPPAAEANRVDNSFENCIRQIAMGCKQPEYNTERTTTYYHSNVIK